MPSGRGIAKRQGRSGRGKGRGTDEGFVDVRHQEFDESFLDVKCLEEAREPWLVDMPQVVMVKKAHEAGIRSLEGCAERQERYG